MYADIYLTETMSAMQLPGNLSNIYFHIPNAYAATDMNREVKADMRKLIQLQYKNTVPVQ